MWLGKVGRVGSQRADLVGSTAPSTMWTVEFCETHSNLSPVREKATDCTHPPIVYIEIS